MSAITVAVLSIFALLVLVLSGVHIGFSLAAMSFVGIWMMTANHVTAFSILATTSFEAIRD